MKQREILADRLPMFSLNDVPNFEIGALYSHYFDKSPLSVGAIATVGFILAKFKRQIRRDVR